MTIKRKRMNDLLTADSWFSKYIRLRDSDSFGMTKCPTCRRVFHWKEMTCSHYRKRRHGATRFNESNAISQCSECNSKHEIDESPYRCHLILKIGLKEVAELERLSNTTVKMGKAELKEIIEKYKLKFEKLEKA